MTSTGFGSKLAKRSKPAPTCTTPAHRALQMLTAFNKPALAVGAIDMTNLGYKLSATDANLAQLNAQ